MSKAGKVPVDAAPTGKRVLVVGAGQAYHLTRPGHPVTIKNAGAEPGARRPISRQARRA